MSQPYLKDLPIDNWRGSEIQQSLEPLFTEAREKGLWFRSPYQDMWFSPDELQSTQLQGRFRWGPVNWELRDPREHLQQLKERVEEMSRAYHQFATKLLNAGIDIS